MFRSRILACTASLLLLSGCTVDLGEPIGIGGGTTGGSALVVGDEPYAVQVGTAILEQGGSAMDAATATYFALAVTYPVAAGLGGGGICIVRDPASDRTEEFDFLARDASGGGTYAVPGNVRGFALMQSIYGALPWQRDVAPGEAYASSGFSISHALAVRLTAAQDVIRLDAALSSEFLDESGAARPAGAVVSNPELAQTLAAIRTDGPLGFYSGSVGARILAYSSTQGGAINVPEFARSRVNRTSPQAARIGNQTVYLPNARTGAGAFAGALFDTLNRAQDSSAGANDLQADVMVAVKQALARFNVTNLPKDLGATGFATMDSNGQTVACAVTMNGPFGSGHTATGTGVTLALSPSSGQAGLASAFITPVIATDGGSVSLAGTGAGGPNGTAAMGFALARLAHGDAIAQRGDLRSTGEAPYETINVLACQRGACVALADPDANGMGAAAAAPPQE